MRQKTKTWVLETEGKHPRAFTLIEMLVVISILTLLVTILVPSLSAAKTHARVAKTKALLHSLNTGLEMFHQDKNVGDDYPPSTWDTTAAGDPYKDSGNGLGDYIAYGAETLLWALTGADQLGTPGFEKLVLHAASGGFYELDAGAPVHYRSGPFFNAPAITVEKIADEKGKEHKGRVLVDTFRSPLLYYRADMSQTRSNPLGIYDPNHNLATYPEDMTSAGADLSAFQDTSTSQLSGAPHNEIEPLTAFHRYVRNPGVEAVYRPHNSESFILISAGPDRIYGNQDDITNFTRTQANYTP